MKAHSSAAPPSRILRIHQTLNMSGLSRTSLYEKMKTNEFPKSVKLGARAVGWREADVIAWMNSLKPSEGGRHG